MAKLYFYYSAMNAGKSTTLLQAAHNYEERGMHVTLFTPELDDRDQVGMISSRIGLKRPATSFGNAFDFFATMQEVHAGNSQSCVLVDESQFLSPAQVLQLTLVVDRLKIPVICYGLRTDFRGEPFDGSKYLLSWADEIHEIKTVCHTGKKATMNARLDEQGMRVQEGQQIEIGHHYVALSRGEFDLLSVTPIDYRPPESPENESPETSRQQ